MSVPAHTLEQSKISKLPEELNAILESCLHDLDLLLQNTGASHSTEPKERTIEKKVSTEKKENIENKINKEDLFCLNSEKMVMLNVPIGKPSRKETSNTYPYMKRKKQSSQKGPLCTYYSMKLHAMLSHDYLERQSQKDRRIASKLRKERTKICSERFYLEVFMAGLAELPEYHELKDKKEIIELALSFLNTLEESWSTEESPDTSEAVKEIVDSIPSYIKDNQPDLRTILPDFLDAFLKSECHSLQDYLEIDILQKNIKAFLDFFTSLELDAVEECRKIEIFREKQAGKQHFGDGGYKPRIIDNFETLSVLEKFNLLNAAAYLKLFEIFDMKSISWRPSDNIQTLLSSLKENGKPLVVSGRFGEDFYHDEPKHSDKIKHYDVCEYSSGSHAKEFDKDTIARGESSIHSIAIIGVEHNYKYAGGGCVYYIDPSDASDPEKDGSRKIYRLDYEKFYKQVSDDTMLFVTVEGKDGVGYATTLPAKPHLRYLYG